MFEKQNERRSKRNTSFDLVLPLVLWSDFRTFLLIELSNIFIVYVTIVFLFFLTLSFDLSTFFSLFYHNVWFFRRIQIRKELKCWYEFAVKEFKMRYLIMIIWLCYIIRVGKIRPMNALCFCRISVNVFLLN